MDRCLKVYYMLLIFLLVIFVTILIAKYPISIALMIENPVRSPMVPPTADNMSINFAALSMVIVSNVGVSK